MWKPVKRSEKFKKVTRWVGPVGLILLGAVFAAFGLWLHNVYQAFIGALCAGLGIINYKFVRRQREQDEDEQRNSRP